MLLPSRSLEAFGPPTPPKVYDTPPIVVVSPRLRRLRKAGSLALQALTRYEAETSLEPCRTDAQRAKAEHAQAVQAKAVQAKAVRPLPVSPPRR